MRLRKVSPSALLFALGARALLPASAALAISLFAPQSAAAQSAYCQPEYCKAPPKCADVGGGVDFHGQTLENVNFANRPAGYLVGADFSGTTLIGVNFAGTNLSNADFTGAILRANDDGARTDLNNATLKGACFLGAEMSGADLQFAAFDGVDFTCASMLDTKFGPLMTFVDSPHRSRFDYAQLGIARSASSFLFPLEAMSAMPSFWKRTAFTCTRLAGLDQANFIPAGKDMSDAILRGIVLDGFAFYDADADRGATLDRADLTGSSLRGANLSRVSLDAATLKRTDLTGADLTKANLYSTAASDLTLALLNNATLNYANFERATLTAAQLHGMQSVGASFDNAIFQATEAYNVASIIGSTFRNASFANAALNNVRFLRSDLSGAQLTGLTLSGASFTDSVMVGTNFEGSTLQDVDFGGAQLNNANFKSTGITATKTGAGVTFTCAQLGGSNFDSATLSKADFSAAVMPPDAQCCPQVQGVYCGAAINGEVYGHTTPPLVPSNAAVTCPNGQTTSCVGADWTIPNWTTSLCNSESRAQVVWAKPQCGDQPKTIDIPDLNLKACVQNALFGGSGQPITKEAAANLKHLICAGQSVADLTGLTKDNFPSLSTLDLTSNNLSGVGDFSQFSEQLEEIKLSNNRYSSLIFSPSSQQMLNLLEASNNQISSVQVSADTYFSFVDLSYNKLAGKQVFFAQRDNNISYIDLSFNQITSVGDVSVLKHAATIYLQGNQITNIGSISQQWADGNGNLMYLELDDNACFQCGSLGVDAKYFPQFGCSCNPSVCGTCK